MGWLRAFSHHQVQSITGFQRVLPLGEANPGIFVRAPSRGEVSGAGPCPQPAPAAGAWRAGGNAAAGTRLGGMEPCRQLSDTCAFLGSIGWSNILHRDNKSLSLLGLN